MERNKVIVIGGNHHNTLGLIRSLGRKGVNSSLILHNPPEMKNAYVLKSKYLSDYDIVVDEGTMLQALRKRMTDEKKVVVCTSDFAASVIDRNYNALRMSFCLPGCREQGLLTRLMNKRTMQEMAQQCGLETPFSVDINNNHELPDNIPYPCIVKPAASIEGVKADIGVFNSRVGLVKHLANCKAQLLHIEQFIEKSMEYQLIGCSLNDGNDIIVPGRSRIITQPVCTNTGFLHYEHLDGTEPIEACKRFLQKAHYNGLFSMEFLRDGQGKDFFMEINFRNDGNSICVTEAGVNLPYIWYKLNTDTGFSIANVNTAIKEKYVMPEFNEIGLWYTQQISFVRMIRELRQADCFMEFTPDDPSPTGGKMAFWKSMMKAVVKRPVRVCYYKLRHKK